MQHSIPIAWLVLTLLVFTLHKPWWPYYYIHNAVPLCWCAGVGIAFAWERLSERRMHKGSNERVTGIRKRQLKPRRFPPFSERPLLLTSAAAVGVICAVSWMAARVFLEVQGIRSAPKLDSALVLKEIERYKPFTKFMFSDQPIYSFHADLPMPPHLAVVSLKRLWSGDINNLRIAAELNQIHPGLILLRNSSTECPFQELLNRDYRLVYQDTNNRLYAHASIATKPPLPLL